MFGITTQLLPVLLLDSANYHPSRGIISVGCCPREIIHSRGDNLHYSPTSQAITVYYVANVLSMDCVYTTSCDVRFQVQQLFVNEIRINLNDS